MAPDLIPPRFGTPRNPQRLTLGREVGEVMAQLGTPPMPWQQHVLDVQYELNADGSLFYREARLGVPRQSGKTSLTLARQVDRSINSEKRGWGKRPLSVYTAQSALAARNKLVEDWFPTLDASPLAARLLPGKQGFVRSNGREQFKFDTGGRMIVVPPSRTGGHGPTVDLADIDEAFAHRDAQVEQAVKPAMITRFSPQLNIQSTAGTIESTYLWGKVDDGRMRVESGSGGRVCYFEWSAGDDEDPADPATWRRCSPAIGYTITIDSIQYEFDSMDIDEFRRAYLNVWTGSQSRIIPAAAWASTLDVKSELVGRLWLAVDASPGAEGGRTASIAVAGYRDDGLIHVEVIEHAAGLSWVADRVRELTHKWTVEAVYLDTTGPIGSVLPDIEAEANANIEVIDTKAMAAACGRFHQAILDGTMRHRGQGELDKAVDGAAKRVLLDSWAWARRTSLTDISPLVAVTLAHWGAVLHPDRGLIQMYVPGS